MDAGPAGQVGPDSRMRVGFFGGTFDPPHRGHAAIARAAAERFGLAEVLWAPAGRQPLKREGCGASYPDRLQMVALACGAADQGSDRHGPRFLPSDVDSPRDDGSVNYTVDTLERLHHRLGGAALFCIAGADSFHELWKWREPHRLLRLAEWIVVSRPGFALAEPERMTLTAEERARVHLLDAVDEDVSATELRRRLRDGQSCADLLAPPVDRYIAAHGLYRG